MGTVVCYRFRFLPAVAVSILSALLLAVPASAFGSLSALTSSSSGPSALARQPWRSRRGGRSYSGSAAVIGQEGHRGCSFTYLQAAPDPLLSADDEDGDGDRPENHRTPFGKAYAIYKSYLTRLWSETSAEQRQRIARDRASAAVRRVEHLMKGEEYADLTVRGTGGTGAGSGWTGDGGDHDEDDPERAERLERSRKKLLEACELMLEAMGGNDNPDAKAEETPSKVAESGGVDPGESEYLQVPGDQEEGKLEIPLPPMMDPGSKTFTVEFPVDLATPNEKKDALQSKKLATTDAEGSADNAPAAKKKPGRSVLFGATMGALVACWVFSGNYIFTGIFTLMTILGQLEYYRMVINTGIYPARRISVLGACSMFVTALFAPDLHQICLPFFALISMVWFLTMRRQVSTIPEISTTFTGMFLLGYIPSFWVRIRLIGGNLEPTRLAPLAAPVLNFLGKKADASLPSILPKAVHFPITTGAVFIFWTWLCLAFSDVGAYFVGRAFGKTKLGEVAPAAGAASPNKTVEGVYGGCLVSAALATLGAWVQRWPYWYVTGPIHGIYLGILGLLGDLTASMIKRDAGIKDFGDLIPEHGGVMDRVDSYIFAAPYSWIVCKYLIPVLSRWTNAGYGAASATGAGVMSIPLVLFFSMRRILHISEKKN